MMDDGGLKNSMGPSLYAKEFALNFHRNEPVEREREKSFKNPDILGFFFSFLGARQNKKISIFVCVQLSLLDEEILGVKNASSIALLGVVAVGVYGSLLPLFVCSPVAINHQPPS